MKTLITFFAVIAIFAITAIASIYYKQSPSIEIIIASDETESKHTIPDWDKIRQSIELNTDIWKGVLVNYFIISDVQLSKSRKVIISAENHLSNELARRKRINDFFTEYEKLALFNDSISSGKNYSSIYLPIAQQLNALSKSKATNRVAYLYSDLKEKTLSLSLYNSKTFKRFQKHPEELIEYYNSLCPLEDLTGINIYLLHQSKSINEESDYLFIAGIYKQMLESKGAIVSIQQGI